MPPAKPTQTTPSPADAAPQYPALEGFIETATADEVEGLFAPVEAGLAALKGPRAEAAKKAGRALARAQELLSFLLQVRETLEADRKAAGKRR